MDGTLPGWVGPTVALSLVVIAAAFAAIGTAAVMAAWATRRKLADLGGKLETIRLDFQRVLEAVRRVTEDGAEEARHYLTTSRAIRADLDRGVRRVKARLAELDALYEVVHDEVQDTALDVAARVRAVRRTAGVVSQLRRWVVRGRR
ncbi:MAG TPA: hypothetical protein VI383_11570 [Gemmatimonadales bacterium]|nr:hypothetical protein [Gemmatimonadales bacterium]